MYYVRRLDNLNLNSVRQNDKEFEKLVRDCANLLHIGEFELYGRNGQKQFGVDVIPSGRKNLIQCKCYDPYNPKSVDRFKNEITEDYKTACEKFPKMEKFIAATTLNIDGKLQDFADDLAGYVKIELWFWDRICEIIDDNRIYTANDLFANSFTEPLFLHKGNDKVCLKNLFVMQEYVEYEDKYIDYLGYEYKYLPDRLRDFISLDKTNLLIIEGDAGSGKTSLVGWLNYHAREDDNDAKNIIGDRPLITLRLRDLDREKITKNGGMTKAIAAYMKLIDFDSVLERYPRAVFVLDGFDELCMIEGLGDYNGLISDLIRKISEDVKIIITSRPNYIGIKGKENAELIQLDHFDRGQRQEWLTRFTSPNYCGQSGMTEEIKNFILSVDDNDVNNICDTPLTLYMLAGSGIGIEKTKNLWELYRCIFYDTTLTTVYNTQFSINKNKLNAEHRAKEIREAIYRVTEEIAYRMFRAGNKKGYYITSNEIDSIIVDLCANDTSFKGVNSEDLKQCYALCTYWKSTGDKGAVEFYHNNIRDFFMCERIYRVVNKQYKSIDDNPESTAEMFREMFKEGILNKTVCGFLRWRSQYDVANKIVTDFPMIEKREKYLPTLYEYMLLEGTLYDNLGVKNHVRAIESILHGTAQVYRYIYEPILGLGDHILWWNDNGAVKDSGIIRYVFDKFIGEIGYRGKFAGADLSGADLRGADLRGADLRGAELNLAFLGGANLSYADLHRADLSGADLLGADLSGADLHNADLSGADLRGANLSSADLSVAILPDGFISEKDRYGENQAETVAHLKSLNIRRLKI